METNGNEFSEIVVEENAEESSLKDSLSSTMNDEDVSGVDPVVQDSTAVEVISDDVSSSEDINVVQHVDMEPELNSSKEENVEDKEEISEAESLVHGSLDGKGKSLDEISFAKEENVEVQEEISELEPPVHVSLNFTDKGESLDEINFDNKDDIPDNKFTEDEDIEQSAEGGGNVIGHEVNGSENIDISENTLLETDRGCLDEENGQNEEEAILTRDILENVLNVKSDELTADSRGLDESGQDKDEAILTRDISENALNLRSDDLIRDTVCLDNENDQDEDAAILTRDILEKILNVRSDDLIKVLSVESNEYEITDCQGQENLTPDGSSCVVTGSQNVFPLKNASVELEREVLSGEGNNVEILMSKDLLQKANNNVHESAIREMTKKIHEVASTFIDLKDNIDIIELLEKLYHYTLTLRQKKMSSQGELAHEEHSAKGETYEEAECSQGDSAAASLINTSIVDAQAVTSKLESVLECSGKQILDLEDNLTMAIEEIEKTRNHAKENENRCLEMYEILLESRNLFVISESYSRELEQVLSAYDQVITELHREYVDGQPLNHSKRLESGYSRTLELVHVYDTLKHFDIGEQSLQRFMELENALLTSREKEYELRENLSALETELSKSKESNRDQDLCMKIERLEKDLFDTSQREIQLDIQLEDSRDKLSMYEKVMQLADIGTLDINKMPDATSDASETSSYDAFYAWSLILQRDMELQCLYDKFDDMKLMLEELQGAVMAERTTTFVAQAELISLTMENSKLKDKFHQVQALNKDLEKRLHHAQSAKRVAISQLTNTARNINELIEKVVCERKSLQKKISILVSENHDLTNKCMEMKNNAQILISTHQSDLIKAKKKEEVLTRNLQNLKVIFSKHLQPPQQDQFESHEKKDVNHNLSSSAGKDDAIEACKGSVLSTASQTTDIEFRKEYQTVCNSNQLQASDSSSHKSVFILLSILITVGISIVIGLYVGKVI